MSAPQNEIPTAWTTGYTDVFNTGTWRAALPVHAWRPSPCLVDCPIDNAMPRWIGSLDAGDHYEAWLTLVETNPFPAVTGRVCHHPCEEHCNRAVLEAAVGINGLEQYLGDLALERGWPLPGPGEVRAERVAVVGGGPAGLSCAYHLRRLGYKVTVFEARERLGGLLHYGIPSYRLSEDVVDREIERVLALGVEVRTGKAVSDRAALDLLVEDYDAVFLAIGAHVPKRLVHLEQGAGAGRVLDGLDYLRRCVDGVARDLGERMVVIGGGSAAMDAARSARRLGHQVSVVALESRALMPAQPEEVEQALEEGVSLFDGAMVSAVEEAPTGVSLSCRKVTLDPAAPPGELRPLPVPGGEFVLSADVIVTAIGQDADLVGYGETLTNAHALVQTDPETLATPRPGVFAGGDVATTVRYVSVALGAGRRAARGIAAHLGHPEVEAPPSYTLEEAVNRKEVNVYYFDFAARNERERASVGDRLQGFAETVCGFPQEVAAAEAARCMTCGTCVECDNCFIFCPDMAVAKDADRETHYAILEQYCKGCGLCVTECPRGAVHLEQVTR